MRRPGERGFILVAVLWALAVFGALATLFLATSNDLLRVSANRNAELRARQGALAGIERARNLLDRLQLRSLADEETRGARAPSPALLHAWNHLDSVFAPLRRECLDGVCYEVRVRDLGALLNVNTADEAMLERFFRALGAEPTEALIAAQSIADWVDPDDVPRRFGAERDFYLLSPAPLQPRNGPVHDPAELLAVRGVHHLLWARAAPYLTTRGSGRINVNSAPPPVLTALRWTSGSARDAAAARLARGELLSGPAALGGGRIPGAVHAAHDLEVVSTARAAGSPLQVEIRAVLQRQGDDLVRTHLFQEVR